MLTDDDLTRELSAAFRTATADLTYAGRTHPPRSMALVLPSVATAATLAAVAVGVGASNDHHPAARRVVNGPITKPTAGRTTKLVTKTIKLAGFTVRYQVAAGSQPPVYAVLDVSGLPADAREVQLSGTEAKAWAGTDRVTGDNAVYVKSPTRNDGKLFALLSPTWSQDQLIDLLTSGTPTQVPAVTDGSRH